MAVFIPSRNHPDPPTRLWGGSDFVSGRLRTSGTGWWSGGCAGWERAGRAARLHLAPDRRAPPRRRLATPAHGYGEDPRFFTSKPESINKKIKPPVKRHLPAKRGCRERCCSCSLLAEQSADFWGLARVFPLEGETDYMSQVFLWCNPGDLQSSQSCHLQTPYLLLQVCYALQIRLPLAPCLAQTNTIISVCPAVPRALQLSPGHPVTPAAPAPRGRGSFLPLSLNTGWPGVPPLLHTAAPARGSRLLAEHKGEWRNVQCCSTALSWSYCIVLFTLKKPRLI